MLLVGIKNIWCHFQRCGEKRKSLSDTPPSLLPASKVAKLHVNTELDTYNILSDSNDDSTMGASIQKHFVRVGEFILC